MPIAVELVALHLEHKLGCCLVWLCVQVRPLPAACAGAPQQDAPAAGAGRGSTGSRAGQEATQSQATTPTTRV